MHRLREQSLRTAASDSNPRVPHHMRSGYEAGEVTVTFEPVAPMKSNGRPLSGWERRVIEAYERWIATVIEGQAAYITLTFKQGLKRDDGTWVRLTREFVSKQMRWILRELDRKVFKSAAIRYGQKLQRAVFIEGDDVGNLRLHVHMIIELPDRGIMAPDGFFQLVRYLWRGSEWGHRQIDFEICDYIPGAAGYSFKTGPDAIDLENTHLSSIKAVSKKSKII